jgi:hypothetical protein
MATESSNETRYENIRYIKLGRGSSNTDKICIERGIAYIGFGTGDPEVFRLASNGLWEDFKSLEFERNAAGSDQARKQRATSATNQVKAFFECNEKTLWITFFAGNLYYGNFSSARAPEVCHGQMHGCIRQLQSKWRCLDANGKALQVENLSGNLTKVRGFQGTSCELDEMQTDYLLRRLSGKVPAYITQIDEARESMALAVKCAIKTLQPKDFEPLVEIIFSRAWRRIGQAGNAEKFIDITFEDPLDPEKRIAVQVKSQTSIEEIRKCCLDDQRDRYEKFIFAFHTPDREDLLGEGGFPEGVEIVDCNRLASLVIDSGLIHWLKEKTT